MDKWFSVSMLSAAAVFVVCVLFFKGKARVESVREQVEFEFVRYALFCDYFESRQLDFNKKLLAAEQELRDARHAFDGGFYVNALVCIEAAFEAKMQAIERAGKGDRKTTQSIRNLVTSAYPVRASDAPLT
jgi:hypothetical protein